MKTLFQTCVIICITMIVFTLAINFVSGLGVFETYESGFDSSGDTDTIFNSTTNLESDDGGSGMDALWAAVLGGAGLGAIVLAWVTRSPVIIGVYIFSAIFWASYINALSVININNWIPAGFLLIGTVAMVFIFGGAVAGMLSGSG